MICQKIKTKKTLLLQGFLCGSKSLNYSNPEPQDTWVKKSFDVILNFNFRGPL